MAVTPPPYNEIDGIYVQIDKHVDAALFTGTNPQNGNARPGQILVDTSDYNVYVGNDSGNVRLIGPSLAQTSVDDDTITLGFEHQNQQILLTDSSTVNVPLNSTLALPIGYAVTFVVGDATSAFVVPEGTAQQKIYLSGSTGTFVQNNTQNVEIPQWSMATLLKIGTTTWMIAGSGLTTN